MNGVIEAVRHAVVGPVSAGGALAGLLCAAGLLLVAARLPWRRVPALDDRIGPYLQDVVVGPVASPVVPIPGLGWLLAPLMAGGVRWAERISGGPGTVRRRLDQLGRGVGVEQFRAEQVLWGVLGALLGAGLALLIAVGRE